MGNIRTKDIKKASSKLIGMYPGKFNADFEHNKRAIDELKIVDVDKKISRNKLAGYISRTMKRKTA